MPRPFWCPWFAWPLPFVDPGATSVRATPFSLYTGVCGWTHSYTKPNTINYCIFEAIQIHTMAHCHAATVTIFHSQIALTVHIYTTSTYISNRHWTGLELLTIFCVSAWAPLSSNIFTHSTCPYNDANISAVHPSCYRECKEKCVSHLCPLPHFCPHLAPILVDGPKWSGGNLVTVMSIRIGLGPRYYWLPLGVTGYATTMGLKWLVRVEARRVPPAIDVKVYKVQSMHRWSGGWVSKMIGTL